VSAQRPCYGDQGNLNFISQSENLKVNLPHMNVDMTRGWTSCPKTWRREVSFGPGCRWERALWPNPVRTGLPRQKVFKIRAIL